MSALPAWVKPEAIAHHIPSATLFPILHCQRHRATGALLLLDAPKGQAGVEFPLSECEPATLAHFSGVALLSIGGKPVTVLRQGNLYIFSNGQTRLGVELSELRAIAEDFASFFGGEVISEEVPF